MSAIAPPPPGRRCAPAAPAHPGRRRATAARSGSGEGRTDLAVAAGLTLLALLWRLPRLGVTPGWDGDEGYNLDIAWHLLHGRAQVFALDYAFVQHPVLGYAVLAPLLGLFGPELWVGRALSAVAGALTCGVLYLAVALSGARRAAVLAALSLGGAHLAVAYSRLGYTYGLLLLWTALTLLATVRWETGRRRRDLWLAAGCAALGLLTDQAGVALPLFVAARVLPRRRAAALVLAAGLTPALLAAAAAAAIHPAAAAADWGHTLGRVAGGGGEAPPGAALARWLLNYFHLLRVEWWWPAAVAGLFCVRPLVARRRLLTLSGLLVLPVFALRELDPFFRTGVPLLVPGAWGLGALLDAGMRAAYETVAPAPAAGFRPSPAAARGRLWGTLLAALVVLLPLGLETGRAAGGLVAGFSLPIDWALLGAPDQAPARRAAAYVNARGGPQSVVVASPHVAWLYRARVADFLQAAAAGGEPVAFYPPGLPPERFRFDPGPAGADFAVIDAYWDRWAAESGPVRRLTDAVAAWPLVWSEGDVRVHQRPGAARPAG